MRMTGGPIIPNRAASAPSRPAEREPNMTEKFTMFGPGSTWHRAISSSNASGASQRLSSTITRRDQASTPPKPQSAILAKARESWKTVGNETREGVKADSHVASCATRGADRSTCSVPRPPSGRRACTAQLSIAPIQRRGEIQRDDPGRPNAKYGAASLHRCLAGFLNIQLVLPAHRVVERAVHDKNGGDPGRRKISKEQRQKYDEADRG